MVAASPLEYGAIMHFLEQKNLRHKVIGRVAVDEATGDSLSSLSMVKNTAHSMGGEALLICAGTLSYQKLIQFTACVHSSLRLLFHDVESSSIVSSDSDSENGETIAVDTEFNIAEPSNSRIKRLIDILSAALLLIVFPIHFLFARNAFSLLKNALQVLGAKKTWVGYFQCRKLLPALRPSVLGPSGLKQNLAVEEQEPVDYWYAKNYDPMHDIQVILKNYKHLG